MVQLHPIQRYCQDHEISQRSLAARAGLSEGFISQLIHGWQWCGADAAVRIKDATNGEVSLEDLLTWDGQSAEI